jgi:pSer/pThr/pTyr-binding forkhead associated (FHA) protein
MRCHFVALAGWPPIRLDRVLVVVGRHPNCDARLVSPRVSRWHCCMTEIEGEVWGRDLASTNGTWIEGRRVSTGRLRTGDVLAIAHLRYRLEELRAELTSRADRPIAPGDGCISTERSSGDGPARGELTQSRDFGGPR